MTDYQKYINALRKCANEHENDRTSTGHIRVSDLCRDTADMIRDDKARIEILGKRVKELETILDKIRDEIEQITDTMGVSYNQYVSKIDVLKIIDKYKADVEPQKSEDAE